MKKFFVHDPLGDGVVFFSTEEEALENADKFIGEYLDDGWSEEVEGVTLGKISHSATQVDRVEHPGDENLDEGCCDEEGNYWGLGFEYMCNYKCLPIDSSKETEEIVATLENSFATLPKPLLRKLTYEDTEVILKNVILPAFVKAGLFREDDL